MVYEDDFKLAGPEKKFEEHGLSSEAILITGESQHIGRHLDCRHRIPEAAILSGGVPAHGDVPETLPESIPAKAFSDDAKVRAVQAKQRAASSKANK